MRADARRPGRILAGTLAVLAAIAPPPSRAAAEEHRGGDVVFLLGEDRRGVSPFLSAAAAYYRRTAPDARIVTTSRTLAEVREYLVRHRGAAAWDEVTLVAHGAPWMGLLVPLHGDGPRASLEAVEAAARHGEFPPLPAGVADDGTRLRLESCGLGRRPEFLAAIAALFGIDAATQVQASTQFVGYRIDGADARRFELPFVSAVFPADGAAGRDRDATLRALADAYVAAGAGDPSAAVVQETPIAFGVDFPEAVPRDADARRARVAGDPAVAARLRSYGLAAGDLAWVDVAAEDGVAARLEGRGTLLVLRAAGGPALPAPDAP